jgi:Bacterial mobilisation protein (MobC)
MPAKPGQKLIGGYVDEALADRFNAWARQTDGGSSAALRRLISRAMDEAEGLHGASPIGPRGVGRGKQVSVRLRDVERAALAEAAAAAGTTPANWLRSLALVHLARRPQWNPAELDALRALARELRAIGNNVNQIAHALNVAVQIGEYPPHQGVAAQEAAELVRYEMRRVVAVMTGNFDYWGLPDAERPIAAPGAEARADAAARAAEAKRKNRRRRQPARFDGD